MKKIKLMGAALMIGLMLVQFQPKPANAIVGIMLSHHGSETGNQGLATTGVVMASVGLILTGYAVPIIACFYSFGFGCGKVTVYGGAGDTGPDIGTFHYGAFASAGLWVNLLGVVLLDNSDGFTGQFAPISTAADATKLKMTSEEQTAYNHELDTINVMAQDFVGRAQEYAKTAKSDTDTESYVHNLWETVAKPNLSPEAYSGLSKVSDSLVVSDVGATQIK